MTRSLAWFSAVGLSLIVALPALAADRAPATTTIDAFVTAVKASKDLPAEKVTTAVAAVQELKADPASHSAAITVGLRELYDEYAGALVELADEKVDAALPKLEKLSKSTDQYLATDATFFLARAYMLAEKFEEAMPLLDTVSTKNAAFTVQHADTMFLKGLCQARLLKRKDALATFTAFAKDFPDAPERMQIGAWRMLQQLELVEDGTIIDVQDRMAFSRRKLAIKDSGKGTQDEQKKIVDILAKLIKEAEEKECNCSGSGKGQGQGQGQGQGAGQGQGSTGGQGSGSDNSRKADEFARLRRTGPESGWSKLRDREREEVFSALQERYPARYQKLIEQYHKSFEDSKK
jgi:tetratricopeptide (TPR) repeat protein